MNARFLFWTGRPASELPVRDVLTFVEYSDEVFEELQELLKASVASGVAEVLDNIDL